MAKAEMTRMDLGLVEAAPWEGVAAAVVAAAAVATKGGGRLVREKWVQIKFTKQQVSQTKCV